MLFISNFVYPFNGEESGAHFLWSVTKASSKNICAGIKFEKNIATFLQVLMDLFEKFTLKLVVLIINIVISFDVFQSHSSGTLVLVKAKN